MFELLGNLMHVSGYKLNWPFLKLLLILPCSVYIFPSRNVSNTRRDHIYILYLEVKIKVFIPHRRDCYIMLLLGVLDNIIKIPRLKEYYDYNNTHKMKLKSFFNLGKGDNYFYKKKLLEAKKVNNKES